MLDLYFKPLEDKARKPIQAHDTDAGWDLFSLEETIIPEKIPFLKLGIISNISFL